MHSSAPWDRNGWKKNLYREIKIYSLNGKIFAVGMDN